jgi:hypothetical protein
MFRKLKRFLKEITNMSAYEVSDDFETLDARIVLLERRVQILEDENIGFINDIYELENIIESLKYNK